MPPSESPKKAGARLRRLLLVVPYLVKHPGTTTDELTRLFGVSKRDLLSDLNLLFVSGLPPYGPGDLIEVDIDDDYPGMIEDRRIRGSDQVSAPVCVSQCFLEMRIGGGEGKVSDLDRTGPQPGDPRRLPGRSGMTTGSSVLELNGVSAGFGTNVVLHGVDLSFLNRNT